MPTHPSIRPDARLALRAAALAFVAGLALGCAPSRASAQGDRGAAPAPAPAPPASQSAHVLNVVALAGQQVPVVPITLVAAEPALAADSAGYGAWRVRTAALALADSVVGEVLAERAPEVQWILPPRLRRIARRSPGIAPDPDAMGQAMMRAPGLKTIPGSLNASLRSLVALSGGRLVLIPAAVGFSRDTLAPAGVRATLVAVLADVRSGNVLWRSQATGSGTTPADALRAALVAALPSEPTAP